MTAARLQRVRPSPAERPKPPDDVQLFTRIAGGDLAALGLLYDRYQDDVRQFAAYAAGGADADDIVQETFLAASQVAARYDGRPCARPWLIGIAVQHIRRRRRGVAQLAKSLSAFGHTLRRSVGRTPEDAVVEGEQFRIFERALGRIAERRRLVFLMIEREAMSGEEVAEALHIPVATVWTRLHYARKELRGALARGGAKR